MTKPPSAARVLLFCMGLGIAYGFVGAMIADVLIAVAGVISNGLDHMPPGLLLETTLGFFVMSVLYGAVIGTAVGVLVGALQGIALAASARSLAGLAGDKAKLARCRLISMAVGIALSVALTVAILLMADVSSMIYIGPMIAIALIQIWLAAGKFAGWFTQEMRTDAVIANQHWTEPGKDAAKWAEPAPDEEA